MITDLAGYDPTRNVPDRYVFDQDLADYWCGFFPAFCRHVNASGSMANQPFELNPWERDFISTLMGWKDRESGLRRYREAFVAIPRKNNKTTLCAALSIAVLMLDQEDGAQIYIAAATREQARLLFDTAAEMIARDPKLAKALQVKESRNRIFKGNSFIRAIPADAKRSHGFNAHWVIFDELHTQPNRDLYEVLHSSQLARKQPGFVSITTAGHDKLSICYEIWEKARMVRDGDVDLPTFLPVIYEATAEDDWTDEDVWRRVNPNYGRSVVPESLRMTFESALKFPAEENKFKNLHLNLWTESETRWIPSAAWQECEGPMPELRGRECVTGLDLASVSDLTALVHVFPIDGKFYLLPTFFMPEEGVARQPSDRQSLYREWIKQGHIVTTPGAATDYAFVKKRILEDAKKYRIREINFDGYQAQHLMQEVARERITTHEVRQNFQGMHPGVKAFEEAVADRTLVHDGNPVMSWNVASTIVEIDANGNKRPMKKKSQGEDGSRGKIDGAVAGCMAMSRAAFEQPKNMYAVRGPITF